jgi:phytoene dehydrogenase-like protein
MADASFDAVVIGGGHHGTIIAPYLAKAGLTVGVYERLDHMGGGAVTEDGPAPGFRMNFCANWTRFYGHPAYKEFNLRDEGLKYVFPETNEAIAFDDGASYVSYPAFSVLPCFFGGGPSDGEDGVQRRKREEDLRANPAVFQSRRRDLSGSHGKVQGNVEAGIWQV